MTHESAVEHIYELVFGRLDKDKHAALEEHLVACEECRDYAETYRVLHAALPTVTGPDAGHPSTDVIVKLALEQESLPPEQRERLEDHLASCGTCKQELESVRRVEEGTPVRIEIPREARVPERPRRRPWRVAALAATILIAALVYPAYLGIVRLAEVSHQIEQLRDQNARLGTRVRELEQRNGWSGAVGMKILRSPLRAGAEPAKIVLDPQQPFVLLAVELIVPRDLAPATVLRFEITGTDGLPCTSPELSVKMARTQIRASGVVTLLAPTSAFGEGDHLLRVSRKDRTDGPPLLEVPFDLANPRRP